jgi:hypothetical protein
MQQNASRRLHGDNVAAPNSNPNNFSINIDDLFRLAQQAPPANPNQRPGTGNRRAQGPGTAARSNTNDELNQALADELQRTAARS